MLIKTQVKRRTQSLNEYILELKQKVYDRKYKEAKLLLTHRKQSVNNSYMAPYDPNVYLLDSLKAKNEKLMRQKELVQQQILKKLEDINKIKVKRGYRRDYPTNKNQTQNPEFISKMQIFQVGIYSSRFPLKLEDVDKIDYETANLQSDFRILRIIVDESSISIGFKQILNTESEQANILICWKNQKVDSKNYLIIRFEKEEDRKYWARCINFAKLISESELKKQLFFKEEENYMINVKAEQPKPQQNATSMNNSKQTNLNISANRSSALDRLRRKSEYYPTLPAYNNLALINRSKLRKVSEDLSMKQPLSRNNYMYERKIVGNEKSQKSFEDELSQPNSIGQRKEQIKKQPQAWKDLSKKNEPNKIQKIKEERQKLTETSKMNQNNNTQSNRQIFFNESSIHWIEEENQEMNSISSQPSKNLVGKKNILDSFNKDQNNDKSEHISQAPAQIEESPLLPYSIRDKMKDKNQGSSTFQVRINQVPMTRQDKPFKLKDIQEIRSQRSHRSRRVQNQQKGQNIKIPDKQNPHESSFGNQMEPQEEEENKENEIQSINEQSADDESQDEGKSGQNSKLNQVQDKSQDIASENENSETQSTKYRLDDLKSGIILLKCSANGWNPHIKKLHLSNNDTQLCYKDEKGQNLKKINLSDISKIEYNSGITTPGISKHIKNHKKQRCLVIRYKEGKNQKLLEFYLPNEKKLQDLQNFYQKLNSYFVFKSSLR